MTRTIDPSEIRPGMTIRWVNYGIAKECKVDTATRLSACVVFVRSPEGGECYIGTGSAVTVLSEPQPEEPTWAGAKVLAGVHRFLRGGKGIKPWRGVYVGGVVGDLPLSWSYVCSRGPVTVIPDNGWTVPDPAPVVPDRIEEWPEEDEHLREHRWRDSDGAIWSSRNGQWGYRYDGGGWWELKVRRHPFDGPWTHVSDT